MKKQSPESQAPCVAGSRFISSEGICVVLPICARRELIGRRRQARFDAGLAAVVCVDAAQPDRRRARVIAGAVAERVRLQMREPGEHIHVASDLLRAAAGSAKARVRPAVAGFHWSWMTPLAA